MLSDQSPAQCPVCVETARDVSVLRQAGGFLVTACDTLGAIGSKPGDVVVSPEEVCGSYTLRVCLSELVAVGASPLLVMSLVCNEWEPTGRKVLSAIRAELDENGYPDIAVTGSTEENMTTTMTALGIAVVGFAASMRWRRTVAGDRLVVVGFPRVGADVLAHAGELLRPSIVQDLIRRDTVGDVIPCGSRGIRHELDVLAHEVGLRMAVREDVRIDLDTSAGPATCALVTVHGSLEDCGLTATEIGVVE
ncbi:MAG TPA: hypothetical protein VN478_05255 [Clostridia bacterium]|nr:hypothetical protein [Clostridia bacterium]